MTTNLQNTQNIDIPNDPGNSFATAYNLGDLDSSLTWNESINTGDLDDFYRLEIESPTEVEIVVDVVSEKLDVDLLRGPSFFDRVFLDDATPSSPLSRTVSLDPGVYYLKIFTFNLRSSAYQVTLNVDSPPPILPPPNDDFANAIPLTGTSGSVTGTNVEATAEVGEPEPTASFSNDSLETVWWDWTAPANGILTVDTDGSNFDTILSAFTGSAVNSLTEVASDDDSGTGLQSQVDFEVIAGTTYYFQVDSWGSSGSSSEGDIVLNWQFEEDDNTSGTEAILIREDFSENFDITNDENFELDGSFLPIPSGLRNDTALEDVVGTQLRVNDSFGRQMGLPMVVEVDDSDDGTALRLQLDTFNPSAITLGDSFFGTGIKTKDTFNRGSDGLAFEARVRLVDSNQNPLSKGIIASVFSLTPNQTVRDEIDFEFLSNFIDDAQNDNTEPSLFTNVFDNDDFSQRGDFGIVDLGIFSGLEGIELTEFNTFRIEWLPNIIRWKVNDIEIRTETGTVPDEDMGIFLNIWANGFEEAFDESLIPTDNLQSNQTFFYDLDYVQIEHISVFNDGSDVLYQSQIPVGPLQSWSIFLDSQTREFEVFSPNLNTPGLVASAIGDFNGDGSASIVYYNPTDGTNSIYSPNQQSWDFLRDTNNPDAPLKTRGVMPMAAVDLDGDETDEVIFYNESNPDFTQGTNFTYNSTTRQFDILTGLGNGGVTADKPFASGNLDDDAAAEIVYADPSSGQVRIFNTDTNTFEPLNLSDPEQVVPGFVPVGTLESQPGNPDLILFQNQTSGETAVFDRSLGSFTEFLATTPNFNALA